MTYNAKYNKQKTEYRKEKFKRVGIDFDKDYYENVLKPAAASVGMPVGTFIKAAVSDYIDNLIDAH